MHNRHPAPGVSTALKKDGTPYYRASVTHQGRHISLGSRSDPSEAGRCYAEARDLLCGTASLTDYSGDAALSFDKWVVLLNFRDNGVFFRNPIYLHKRYFSYYLDPDTELKFDTDDLFFYAEHRIQRRGGHLFCENYGMQLSLRSRYGIRPFAVAGRDFRFVNGDDLDYRYSNIKVINRYLGVERVEGSFPPRYRSSIHVRGSFHLGIYDTEEEAAIAYNKALDLLNRSSRKKAGMHSNFIENLSASGYAEIYTGISISEKFIRYLKQE